MDVFEAVETRPAPSTRNYGQDNGRHGAKKLTNTGGGSMQMLLRLTGKTVVNAWQLAMIMHQAGKHLVLPTSKAAGQAYANHAKDFW